MVKDEELYFDVIIVGGGPIGIACALEAKRRGLRYRVLEKGTVVNSIYHYPTNMHFFSTSDRLEIGGVPFVSNNPKPTRTEALEYYRRVAADNRINIALFEEVRAVESTGDAMQRYRITSAKRIYFTQNVIVATGFYDIPYLLNVPGEDLSKVKHYYRDPNYYSFQKVLVVGAQNSAVDAALETWRKGAEVTMAIRGGEIGRRVKYWVKPDIENRIAEGSIKAYFNTNVEAIRPGEVDLNTPDGVITIENDWVLALTGYQPNIPFLRNIGIRLEEDEVCKPEYDDTTHETNLPGVYLAGVICGGMNTHRLFIENSRVHAATILNHITGTMQQQTAG